MRDALWFETKFGPAWHIPEEMWRRLVDLYGIGFVVVECAKADLWLLANPTRQKTHRGMPRFLNGWMARAAKEQAKRPSDAHMVCQEKMTDDQCKDIWNRFYVRWRDSGSPHAKDMIRGCPPELLIEFEAKYEARGKG